MKSIYTSPDIRLFFLRFFFSCMVLGLLTTAEGFGQQRETIVGWNFNNPDPALRANPSGGVLAILAGPLTTQGASAVGWSEVTHDNQGFSARATNWNNGVDSKAWQVDFSTEGYKSIQISSKQSSGPTGPRDFQLQYRLDLEDEWIDVGSQIVIITADDWSTDYRYIDQPLPIEVNEVEKVYLRWVIKSLFRIDGGNLASLGVSRIDDIIITGAPVSSEIELTGNPAIAGNITNPLNHFLYRVDLDVSENDAVLDELRFVNNNSFNEADVAVFKLWRSNPSNNLIDSIASFTPTTNNQNIIFPNLNEDLLEDGTYYYAITVNIDPSAGYGNTLTLGTPEVGFSTNANVSSSDPIPAGTEQTILIRSEVSLASFSEVAPDNELSLPANNRVYRLDISAEVFDAIVDEVSFPLSGNFEASDISAFKLAFSSDSVEIPGTILQTIPNTSIGFGGTVTFNTFTAQRVNAGQTGYFSLLVDIPPGAVNGKTIGVGSVGEPQLSFAHPILETTTGWPQAAGNLQEIALASDITVNSFSPDDLAPRQNSLNNLLYRIDLSVANSNNVLNSLALTTTGSYQLADIAQFSLWTGPDASGPVTRIKDNVAPVASGGTLTFNAFDVPPVLTAGSNLYLYVRVNFTAGAAPGNTIGIAATVPPGTAFGFGDLSTVSGTLAASTPQTITAAPGVVLSGNSPEGTSAITQLTNNRIYRIVMDVTAANARVTEIRVPTQGSYQIPDIAEFSLWYSTDIGNPGTPIATASSIVAPGGTLTFAGLSQVVTVGTGYFSVMVNVRTDAVYGRTIGINQPNLAGIDFEGVVFETGSFTTGSTRAINVPTEVTFASFSNAAPNNILNQPTGNRVFRLDLDVDNFNARLTALTLKTSGTYNATDITGFNLHYSTDPNEIGALIAGPLTAPASGGNLVFSGLTQVFPAGETGYLWLMADISPSATGNRTIGIDAIAAGDVTLANASNKIGLPTPVSNLQVISVPVDISVATFSPASDQILQGAVNRLLYRYDLSLGATSDARLSAISMITQGDYDVTDFVNFKLWYAATETWPTASTLATVTTIPESGQPLTFTGFERLFTADETGYLYVTADVAVAAFPGNSVGIAGTTTAGGLTFLDAVNLEPTDFPTDPGNNQTIEASSKITVTTSSPPAGNLSVLLDNEIYQLEMTANEGDATLESITLKTNGDYVTGDVTFFKLWYSTTGIDKGVEIDNVVGEANGQDLVFNSFTPIVFEADEDPEITYYFTITADISPSANYGNTLGIDELPLSNIEFTIPVMYNGVDPQPAGNLQTIAIETEVTLSSVAPPGDPAGFLTSPTNNPIYRLIAGVQTFDAIVNSITFTTSGSFIAGDISNFKLFYSTAEAAEGDLIATLSGNTLAFGGDVVFDVFTGFDGRIEAGSTAYFWLMVDISPTASNTRTVGVDSTTVDFAFPEDLTDDTNPGNNLVMDVPSEIVVSFSSAPEDGAIQQNTNNNLLYKVHISVTNSDALLQELTFPFNGTYADADIGDVILWYSSDSTVLGSIVETTSAAPSGNSIVFEEINQNIAAGTTAYYSITVNVPATATPGNTIGINPVTIAEANFEESSNIVGSPTGTGNLQTIALSPKIAIANTLPLPDGDIVVPLLNPIYTFNLAVADADALLNSLQFSTGSVYVPADIASIALYYSDDEPSDAGIEIASTTTIPGPGGSILFEDLNLTLPADSTGYFTIMVNVAPSAVIGNNISIVGIPYANIGLADPKIITTTDPLINGNARIFNIPSLIELSSFSPDADTITTPTNNKLIRLDLDVSQFDALLNGLTLTTKGKFIATDVSRFKLWLSVDGEALSEELAVFDTPIVAGGNIVFSGIGAERLSAEGIRYLWVTVDIAPTSLRLNEIGIDVIAAPAAFNFAHPVDFTNTFPVAGSELQVIDVFSGITVSTFAPLAANLRQTAKDQLIYRIDLSVADSDTRLNALTLATGGDFEATDIDRFALWFSADENDPGVEPIAIFDGPIAAEDPLTFAGLNQIIPAASSGYLFITVDIAEEAEPGNTLSVALADLEDLVFSPSVNVSGDDIDPGNTFTIVAAPVIAIDFISPPANGEIKQLEDNLIYTLTMEVSSADVEISVLQFPTKGTYGISDFARFKLWYSEDDEDLLGAVLIADLAPVAAGQNLVFSGLSQSIVVGNTGYFSITVDVETSAGFGNTIGIDTVAYSGLSFVGEVILTDAGPAGAGNNQTIANESNVTITGVSPLAGGVLSSPVNNVIYRIDLETEDFDALLASLTFTTTGSYAATDITGFELWYSDTDAAPGDVIASAAPAGNGSQVIFNLSSQPERFSAGSTGYLWITVDIAFGSEGLPTIGIEGIPLANFGFLHIVNLDGDDPTEEGALQIIDVPSDIVVTGVSAPEGNVNQNAVNQVLYTLQLEVDDSDARLLELNLPLIGTLEEGDVTAFKLWFSTTGFNLETELAATVIIEGDSISFTGFNLVIPATGSGYFTITADIAFNAFVDSTLGIGAVEAKAFIFDESAILTGVPTPEGNLKTIVASSVIAISGFSEAGPITSTEGNLLYRIDMEVTVVDARLTGLQLPMTGDFTAADVSAFGLWYKTSSVTDSVEIATAGPVGNGENLVFTFNQVIEADSSAFFFVMVDISTAAQYGNTIGVGAISLTNLTFDEVVILNGDNPLPAGEIRPIEIQSNVAAIGVVLEEGDIEELTNNLLYRIDLATSDFDAQLQGLTLTTFGSYEEEDVDRFVLLWSATAGGSREELAVLASVQTGENLVFDGFNLTLPAGEDRFFWVSVDISSDYAVLEGEDSRTIGINAIPLTAFEFEYDTEIINAVDGDPSANLPQGEEREITIRPIVNLTRTSGPSNIINILAPNNHLLYRINAAVTLANARVDSIIVPTIGTYLADDINAFRLFFATDPNAQGVELASVSSVGGFGENLIFVFPEPQLIEAGQTGSFFVRVDANPAAEDLGFDGRTVGIGAVPLSNIKFTAQVAKTGTDPLAAGSLRAIVNRRDVDVEVVSAFPFQMPGSTTLSSVDNISENDKILVYKLEIIDNGSSDDLDTDVTSIKLIPGTSNTADWSSNIGGVSLVNTSVSNDIQFSNLQITDEGINILFEPGSLVVSNANTVEIDVYIWLDALSGNIQDKEVLSFTIPSLHEGSYTSTTNSSQFLDEFDPESIFESNTFTIQVVGTQFEFVNLPTVPVENPFDLQLRATDIYGNVDLDQQVNPDEFNITFEIGQGDQTEFDGSNALIDFNSETGIYTTTGLEYNQNEFITIIANPLGFPSVESGLIQVGDPANLIVREALTITQNLNVGGYVDILSAGNLTLAEGVTLNVGGNFTNSGILNTSSGTTIVLKGTDPTLVGPVVISGNDMTLWNLTIDEDAVVVNEANITLINTLRVNADASFDADGSDGARNFTLLSNASGTARIGPLVDGAVVNGAVNWQRHIQPGQGWRAIASPIIGWSLADIAANIRLQGLSDLRPNNAINIFSFDETESTEDNGGRSGWVPFTSLNQSPLMGTGTFVFIYNVDFGGGFARLTKRGEINSGTIDVPVTLTESSFEGGGWNFLSNPYPSEIDWVAVAGEEGTNDNIGAVSIWNPNNGTGGNYGSYAPGNGAGVGGVGRYIASGQSFFVQTSAAGDVTFQESHKSDQNGQSFVRNRELSDILKMQIRSSGNHRDELAIVFDEESTPEFDRLYDAPKFPGGNIQIYTRSADDRNLSINAPGKLRGAKSFPIYMNPVFFGKYTLSFSELQSFHPNAEIYLIDHLKDEQQRIGEGFTYDFDAVKDNASTYAHGRFELLFAHPVELSMEESYARRNQEVLMPVNARYFEGIHNAELQFGWDESQVEYLGLELAADIKDQIIVSAKKESGKVEVQLTSPLAELPALADDEALLWLRLSLKPGVQRAEIQLLRNQLRAAGAVTLPVVSANGWLIARNTLALTGAVSTAQGQRIDGIRFAIDGPEHAEVITNAEGMFETEIEDEGMYTIRPLNLERLLTLSAEPSVADVIALRRHLLSIQKFESPFAHIAADFNVSGSLSAMDIASLNQHILRAPGHRTADWVMVKESPALAQNPFAFSSEYQFDASTFGEGLLGWRAVQKGIVHMPAGWGRNASGEWEVLSKILRYENGTVEVPVMAGVHSGLAGYQFTLSWNAEDYEFVSLQSNVPGLQYNAVDAAKGQLAVLWTHEQGKGVSFSGQEELFRLVMKGKKDEAGDLSIGSSMTTALAVGEGMQLLELKHNSLGSFKVFDNPVLFPLYPNPAREYTHIHFSIPEDDEVTLTVYSITGERLHLHKQVYRAGENQYMWNLRGEVGTRVNSGIYIIHLETNGYISSQRLIIE
ncbi:MAG: T9SS type A sorting domain-containing protein [Cyclobacteriaceae bacterium]|nr:T9SS type A sorting domain-containing protein [Cyclobacteriaceae bacterium]